MSDEFWERPETVEQFAARDPDHRLVRLVEEGRVAPGARVLDLGCAAGRNTVYLVERGFDVQALDASTAMVARTRQRLAVLLAEAEARERVREGRMDRLDGYADASFDLILALGIYHNARSWDEWERSVAESARLLKIGGLLLVNHFTPETDLTGEGVRPMTDDPRVHEGFPGGRTVLLDAATLDAAISRHGLVPVEPSGTVRVETPRGRRVSVNSLYAREDPRPGRSVTNRL